MRHRRNRYLAGLWLARWGFALAVAVALVVSLTIAATVPVPTESMVQAQQKLKEGEL